MSSLNYRFWCLQPDGELQRYRYGSKTGARALWESFEVHWTDSADPGRDLAEQLSKHGVEGLFGAIPDPGSRAAILEEVLAGDSLMTISARLWRDIAITHRVTIAQAAQLAREWPLAFADPYLKKAQLALAMAAAVMRSHGVVVDTSNLTAFTDYQVPRVLRALGVLRYSSALVDAVDGRKPLAEDSQEERSIRSATILACDVIAEYQGCTATEVDSMLWLSQEVAGDAPFHLTYTTRY